MISKCSILPLVAVLATAGIARAQVWPGTPMPVDPANQVGLRRLSLTDQGFVRAAAAALPAEVQLASLAEERGATSAVRELGRQLVHQHHRIGFELRRLAEGERLALPPAKPPSEVRLYLRLQALSSADFDRAFLGQQHVDLAEEIELFRTEAISGTHPSLRAFAHRQLGELRKEAKAAAATDRDRQ